VHSSELCVPECEGFNRKISLIFLFKFKPLTKKADILMGIRELSRMRRTAVGAIKREKIREKDKLFFAEQSNRFFLLFTPLF